MPHAAPTTKQEARRALATAMISIGRSRDPEAEMRAHEPTIASAMALLGRDFSARRFFAACGGAAFSVTPAGERPALPETAVQALRALWQRDFGVAEPGLVAIEAVTGGEREGFELTFTAGGERWHAFAIEYQDQWVFAPGPVGREDLDTVTRAALMHFDLFHRLGLRLARTGPAQLDAIRDALLPCRVLWPHERDPYGACDRWPLVVQFDNPLVDGRAFYCGFDPATGRAEAYHTDARP